jgi:hypothetical protein
MFFNFWNENKNAMPITNKDEEKRRWERQRENENHKTLNHTPPQNPKPNNRIKTGFVKIIGPFFILTLLGN